MKFERVLCLAPHVDDVEFGCGATLSRLIREGSEIFYAAFSLAIDSLPKGMKSTITHEEVKKSTELLGIPSKNLDIMHYRVRHFPEVRQHILEDMVSMYKEINPDLVLVPSSFDTHQDHEVIHEEGFRAFKKTTIFGYEAPRNNRYFNIGVFVKIEEGDLDNKLEALDCYNSQKNRNYVDEEFIKGLARVRGTQADCLYAEMFEGIRIFI